MAGTNFLQKTPPAARADSATMLLIREMRPIAAFLGFLCLFVAAGTLQAQSETGSLEFVARVTPTAARAEPVREFTFYILRKSYEEIAKEIGANDTLPARDSFIDELKVSPELKTWLKGHEILDLTMPGLDKAVTPDDIIKVPEFLLAYQRSNSGGVTNGIPKPKYSDADKVEHPDRYEKQKQEYLL